jgi:2-polyprenyl-6-methoxyphenol hydroxylase-like FAD-dependent oxidoreductase
MMLAYLLARQGVDVVVLEKHKDFLRDFRGDTVHASTLEALSELGLLDRFLALPHQQYPRFDLSLDGKRYHVLDLEAVPTVCKFVAFMPQWDFLNFLASEAAAYPAFKLLMETEGVGLIRDGKRIVGVCAESKEEKMEIRADLVVACDGRTSRFREEAGLKPKEFGIPIDVLWMRLGKRPGMPNEVLGYIDKGRFLVLIDRGDYFQGGYLIPKGGFEGIKAGGLPAFRAKLVEIAPFLAEVIEELADWDQVKLLTVRIDRLEEWAIDGLLCIGDAAHAMSPAGGVGINLAIQDAIATSNLLTEWLQKGRVPLKGLRRVQKRRLWPTRVLQWMQRMIHARMVRPGGTANLAFFLRIISRLTPLRALFGRLIAMGPRMEHVDLRSR